MLAYISKAIIRRPPGWRSGKSTTVRLAGHSLQEQRAPPVVFSVWAFSQLQCIADCLPHEHLASFAQMQPPSLPQQVFGTTAVVEDILIGLLVSW